MFVGLANYFHAHVHNMAEKMHPLHAMLPNYTKATSNRTLQWSTDQEAAFERVKADVADCPALFFVDSESPIYVQTDASDYGIGAYIFQIVDGVEKPISFISKSLTKEQLKWSTPDKEAYAIFYSLKNSEYLLRDVHFILQTGHKNLTYLNMEGSPKVQRWKSVVMEYDFSIQYLPGEGNVVADASSRLCAIYEPEVLAARTESEEREGRIPPALYKILSSVHNSRAGHQGVEHTFQRLAQRRDLIPVNAPEVEVFRTHWPKMKAYTKQFIRRCPLCQKMSDVHWAIWTRPLTTAAYDSMEVLNINAIGPLPADKEGNCYVLAIIDCFCRWLELYPLKGTSAEEAADCLINYVGRFGIPSNLRSDRGPQFANQCIANLCQLLGVEQDLTIAYSKQENAIVECSNKETMPYLTAIMFDKRVCHEWGRTDLPKVMRIINSTIHSSIGISPAQMLFGNAVNLDRSILLPEKPRRGQQEIRVSEFLDRMFHRQSQLIQVAQEKQRELDDRHMAEAYRDGARVTEFPIRGPLQVVNRLGNKYTVQNLVTQKQYDVFIKRLVPFHYDPERVDHKEIARKDEREFLIDHIIAHEGILNVV